MVFESGNGCLVFKPSQVPYIFRPHKFKQPIEISQESSRTSKVNCCVKGCKNSYYSTDATVQFYRFPARQHELLRREVWISNILRAGGLCKWQPTINSRICSGHFLGNKKSNHPLHPAYHPTIFPRLKDIEIENNAVALNQYMGVNRRTYSRRAKADKDGQTGQFEFVDADAVEQEATSEGENTPLDRYTAVAEVMDEDDNVGEEENTTPLDKYTQTIKEEIDSRKDNDVFEFICVMVDSCNVSVQCNIPGRC